MPAPRHLMIMALIALGVGCDGTIYVEKMAASGVAPIAIERPTGPEGAIGWWPALRPGKGNTLHLAYCDASRGLVRYGHRDASGLLELETADNRGTVGKYLALAVDDADAPHLLYHDQGTRFLVYATREAGRWQYEQVAWGPEIGMGSRLLAARGRLYAIFYDQADVGHLRLAIRAPRAEQPIGSADAWRVSTVDRAGGSADQWTDLAVVGDWLVASYAHWNFVDSELRLGSIPLAGGEWQRRVLVPPRSGDVGRMSSLVIDDKDQLLIAFSSQPGGRAYFAQVPAEDQLVKPSRLARDLRRLRLAAARNGDLVLAAAENEHGADDRSVLIVLRRRAGKWQRTLIDERRPVAGFLDVAAGPHGEAMVLYSAEVDRGLWLYDEMRVETRVLDRRPSTEPVSAPATAVP